MSYVVLMIAHGVDFFCLILMIALILRMWLSFFDPEGEGLILRFAAFLTEPLLILGERILVMLKFDNSGPFDFSFIISSSVLIIIRSLLTTVIG